MQINEGIIKFKFRISKIHKYFIFIKNKLLET